MATATSKKSAESGNRPVHEIRLGRVKAAIWANETSSGPRHNVTFQRIYREGETWKSSDSFGRDDLPLVMKLADQVHSWIYEQGQEPASKEQSF